MTVSSFSQIQSEAAIRLLLAGRRQDGKVAVAEGQVFDHLVQALPWQAEHDRHYFVVTEAAKIRNTLASHRKEFLSSQCACFHTTAEQEAVINLLVRVLGADGVAPTESAFLAEVQQVFSLQP